MSREKTARIASSLRIEAQSLAQEIERLQKLEEVLSITGEDEHVATTALSALGRIRAEVARMERAVVFWAHGDVGLGQRAIGRALGLSNRTINTWVKSASEQEQAEAVQTLIATAHDSERDSWHRGLKPE